jgi:hypothetical protein
MPLIQIDGSQAGGGDGLTITGSDVTVRGLDITDFSQGAGIHITGPGATGNWIYGNFLGTDPTGTQALSSSEGVLIDAGATQNLIGTNGDGVNDTAKRNLLSGNLFAGVQITGQGTSNNAVAGNFIGTDVTGTIALGTQLTVGVQIDSGAASNTIGGTAAGAGNVISGNAGLGVFINGAGSPGNLVQGNKIGTDPTGTAALGNAGGGVQITNGADSNTIGGPTANAGNLITDNAGPGVYVGASPSDASIGNEITGNRIFANTGQAIDLGDDGVTKNAAAPRQGPNNLQNFPIIFTAANGQLEGGLWGSLPGTTYHIDIFASATYGPRGSGEAEDYLGSKEVTTDASGQVVFTLPFAAPAGLPVVTATATDPQGNTSEVTALRRPALKLPPPSFRVVPGQAVIFSAASGDGITIQDPDAGPLNPVWNLTLSVTAGSLTLPSTAGLTGSGRGTGSLSYSGPLLAVDAALDLLTYTPPIGPHLFTTLTLDARSYGSTSPEAQFPLTDGVLEVSTTDDDGPGSLRQAILDATDVTAGQVAIDFAIPGAGVLTITPITPLPPITTSVLFDGTSQPGYDGTPLIAISQSPGSSDPLAISGGTLTIRGLAISGVAIDATADELLIADLHAQGLSTPLSLLDAQGRLLTQSNGLSPTDRDQVVDEHLAAGDYSLTMDSPGGAGVYTWTTMLTPAAAPFQPISAGIHPSFFPTQTKTIVAGDFNGDGHLDLAAAGQGSNEVSVLLGNGDGTFQPAVQDAVGATPDAIVARDFTGTGRLDLAVTDYASNDVSILLGNGDGTFQPAVQYAVGPSPVALVAGDFSGDGKVDLAVADQGSGFGGTVPGGVVVLLGNGDGSFQPAKELGVGDPSPGEIVAGDFTGDGRLDLAVVNTGGFDQSGNFVLGGVFVLLGNGDGTFQPAVQYAVGAEPGALLTGDFTGRGPLDLAVVDSFSNDVAILLGNGDGTFQPAVMYTVGGHPGDLESGDFTSHGRLDLAVVDSAGLQILPGNGDGTFQPAETVETAHVSLAIVAGDFNGDGRPDLVGMVGNGTLFVLLGNGDGTFQEPKKPNAVAPFPGSVVAGDFTGDGRLDLAVTDYAGVQMLLGNGDGTFQPAQTVAALGAGIAGLVAADFNGDGRLDLALVTPGSNSVSVLLGNGDGTFQPAAQYVAGVQPGGLVAGDFTGDGHLDLAVADGGGYDQNGNQVPSGVSILLGNGDGTFQPPVLYAVGQAPQAMVAGDFTGNGHLDLAFANVFSTGVFVMLGNGDGTFQPAVRYAAGIQPGAIVAGDFTGDGHLDLAVADGGGPDQNGNQVPGGVSILLGNGDGTFHPGAQYLTGAVSDSIVAGDFNGDGKLDLAFDNIGSNVSLLLGNGDGTFAVGTTLSADGAGYFTAGDFAGDGRLDLAVNDFISNDVAVLLGNGDGTFSDPARLAATPRATPLVADVSGAGTHDVLVVDGAGNTLYRQGVPGQPGAFEPPATINPGNPSRDIAWLPNTDQGPVLASVDARDDAVTLYALRNGRFVRLGSLDTGRLPVQVVAADLNGDGFTDLVVRNAADSTLSVFFGTSFDRSSFLGPINPVFTPPSFSPPLTLSTGIGASDVQAIDTIGNGRLDLVVTNKLTGQLSILPNLGNGTFGPLEPTRAGTGLSAIDPASSPEVTSLDGTSGLAAGRLSPGGPLDLVTTNPGSNTLGVLASLGGGLFANPVAVDTQSSAQVIRLVDLTGNGILDLVLLGLAGVSVMLGDGKGGFKPPVNYNIGSDPTGLTVADINGDGIPDLLLGDAYGDLSVLLGNGDGTFAPYHEANQAVALAVADLTGNGSKDVIFADQGLDRVVVDYGAGGNTVLGDHATGLLDPGAVKLADLNGDGIPDLIVANSGSNNVLIYPGLGNGQFGPAVNGGNGYFVGTNPVGITLANLTGALPDLVVADKGSNQVSILLNKSQGGNFSFDLGPRLNSGGIGPVSTVVGHFMGSPNQDILVTNSGSNNVALLPGVGGGFFNDTKPQTFAVGNNPGPIFTGNFDGKPDLVTVNAGSNNLTLISDFLAPDSVTDTISSGGTDPVTAFSFSASSGFDDLVVGNGGDGVLALFEGSDQGLSLSSTETNPDLPSPSALVYAGLTGGQVQFYGASEGREAAALVALSLGGEIATLTSAVAPVTPAVAQVVPLQESSLALVSTLLITTVPSPTTEVNLEPAENEVATTVSLATTAAASFGQSVPVQPRDGEGGGSGDEPPPQTPEAKAAVTPEVPAGPTWQGHVLGTDDAIERFDREHPDLSHPSRPEPRQPEKAQEGGHSTSADRFEAIEQAIEGFFDRRPRETRQVFNGMMINLVGFTYSTKDKQQCDYVAALALAATVAGELYFGSTRHASRSRRRFPELRERWNTNHGAENRSGVRN